ncbi:MAG: 50S ribosomal protein L28 [Planctomycetota bacterium]
MSRVCVICGKKTEVGNQIKRRGLAKWKGGVGRKITGKTKRKFKPNLQRVKANVDGTIKRIKVCTRCISAGKIVKAVSRQL